MVRHSLWLIILTILMVIFAPMVHLVLHWVYLLMTELTRILGQAFASNQVGQWLTRILVILVFVGLSTGMYALANKLINHKLPFAKYTVLWASWLTIALTLVLKA